MTAPLFFFAKLQAESRAALLTHFQKQPLNVFCKKSILKKVWACNIIKKETPTQVFSCEFCEILEQLFHRTPLGEMLLNFMSLVSFYTYWNL